MTTTYTDAQIDVVAKLIADKCGNGMREKYEDVACQIVETLTERQAGSSVLSTIIERIGSDPTTTITSKEVCALMETRPDSPVGSSGDVRGDLMVKLQRLSGEFDDMAWHCANVNGDLSSAYGKCHDALQLLLDQPPQPPTKESVEKVCAGCKGKRERFNDVHNRMMTCPHCQGTGKESVRGVSDADVLHACIDYYGVPAWEFMSHKAGCLKNMRAVLESFANRGDGDE